MEKGSLHYCGKCINHKLKKLQGQTNKASEILHLVQEPDFTPLPVRALVGASASSSEICYCRPCSTDVGLALVELSTIH